MTYFGLDRRVQQQNGNAHNILLGTGEANPASPPSQPTTACDLRGRWRRSTAQLQPLTGPGGPQPPGKSTPGLVRPIGAVETRLCASKRVRVRVVNALVCTSRCMVCACETLPVQTSARAPCTTSCELCSAPPLRAVKCQALCANFRGSQGVPRKLCKLTND